MFFLTIMILQQPYHRVAIFVGYSSTQRDEACLIYTLIVVYTSSGGCLHCSAAYCCIVQLL